MSVPLWGASSKLKVPKYGVSSFTRLISECPERGGDGISWSLDVTGIPFHESSHSLSQNFITPPAKEAPRSNREVLFSAEHIVSQTLHYDLR